MTEGEINKMLRMGLECSLDLEKQGRFEVARQVLASTSKWADFQLNLSGLRQNYVNSTWCPTCGVKHTEWLQRDSIHKQGECLSCSHVRSEVNEHFNEAYYE